MNSAALPEIGDADLDLVLDYLASDTSPVCLAVPAARAAETSTLLRSTVVHRARAEQLATLLDESVIGDRRLLSIPHLNALALLLGEISETALPEARQAEQLAAEYREKSLIES